MTNSLSATDSATRLFGPAQTRWIKEHLDQVIASEQFSQAKFVDLFEREFASFVSRRHAIAVSSGTVALELAARALLRRGRAAAGVYPVLTVPMVPWALTRAGLTATPVDVTDGFLPDAEAFFDRARRDGFGVVVWTAGLMSSGLIDAIRDLRAAGVPVLEDGSHAHGCRLGESLAGGLGDVAVFSLYSTKVMTCGEGGVLALDDDDLADWIRVFANEGKPRGSLRNEAEGWNGRMSEMQAVLALSCLRFWDDIIVRRDGLANVYRAAGIPSVQDEVPGLRPTWYKYTVRVEDADRAIDAIRRAGGRTTARTHGPDDNRGRPFELPGAHRISNRHISLPTSWVSPDDAGRIAASFRAAGLDTPDRHGSPAPE